jgi:hypothetical protein
VDVGSLAVQHSEPVVVQQHGRLRLGVTPAHRQLRQRTPHNRDRRRRSAMRIALTLINNGCQQHAEQTSFAKLFHCFLSRKCLTAHTKFHLLWSGSVDHGRAASRI